ncbi:MAG: LuxR C-terminal-related transcriptional regulator [Thermoanaerobaculia bacterium]
MSGDPGRKHRLLSDGVWSLLSQRLKLSPREEEIVRGLLNKRTEKGIAREIGISRHTVHSHIKRLYRKLNVTSRSAAISRVFEEYLRLEQSQEREPAEP